MTNREKEDQEIAPKGGISSADILDKWYKEILYPANPYEPDQMLELVRRARQKERERCLDIVSSFYEKYPKTWGRAYDEPVKWTTLQLAKIIQEDSE